MRASIIFSTISISELAFASIALGLNAPIHVIVFALVASAIFALNGIVSSIEETKS